MILDDGTVIPSNLRVIYSNQDQVTHLTNRRSAIMAGQIVARYSPKHKKNRSKKFYEYDVRVVESGVKQTGAVMELPNCHAISGFGNDKSYRTIRKGTFVYVLCVWGATTQGVIIGGVPTVVQKAEEGEHLVQSFNGMEATVNNDGELTITYNGAQNDKGATEATTGGTVVKIDKTGSVTIDDGAGQSIVVDKTTKTISVSATTAMTLESMGPWTVRAPAIAIESQGAVAISAPGGLAIAGGAGGAPAPMLKGDAVAEALAALITVFLANAPLMGVTGSSPGQPTPMGPALIAALGQWQAQWIASGALLAPNATIAP